MKIPRSGIKQKLHHVEATEPPRRVVQRCRAPLEIRGTCEAEKTVADILTLKQHEEQEKNNERASR